MSDIFKDKNIYPPEEGKIKEHFKNYYEEVFIALMPFFKIGKNDATIQNFKKSEEITYTQLKQEDPTFNNIPEFNAEIYTTNKIYPSDKEIYEKGELVSWNEVLTGAELNNLSELNRALRTSIGGLKQAFSRPDLAKKLDVYTKNENIWHPGEGGYDLFSKVAIYKTLKLFGKNEILVIDEFFDKVSELQLNNLTEFQFFEQVDFKDYYIYSADKELLFTISWDDFFFLLATDKLKMKKILSTNLFEGFLCNNETEPFW